MDFLPQLLQCTNLNLMAMLAKCQSCGQAAYSSPNDQNKEFPAVRPVLFTRDGWHPPSRTNVRCDKMSKSPATKCCSKCALKATFLFKSLSGANLSTPNVLTRLDAPSGSLRSAVNAVNVVSTEISSAGYPGGGRSAPTFSHPLQPTPRASRVRL